MHRGKRKRNHARPLVVALAALVLLVPGSAAAASIERLRAFTRDTTTARAQFTQTVRDKNGHETATARGEFMLSRPGKFRWSVDKPYRQLLVGDGRKVWIFDEDLNQVVVRRIGEALGATPAALLAGNQDVERAFEWKELPVREGLDWLSATPRAKDSTFNEIRLGFDVRGLAALEMQDAFGQTSTVRFLSIERNPKLDADLFLFVPPKGADVIGDLN